MFQRKGPARKVILEAAVSSTMHLQAIMESLYVDMVY
jgi:hypothetical protein